MTLYYNPAYSSSPYRKAASDVEFGNIYCGDVQLLQRLLFYAGVAYRVAASGHHSQWRRYSKQLTATTTNIKNEITKPLKSFFIG